ncbi:acyl-CoA synthetase [Mycobacterium paraintracellulare]|uniref:acyl-CoA ligase FadD12 n=1 Tax=Mycobacterium paraintracellulare TaxID=1138383 RepID=UPI0019272DE8|nr:acyl-CoA ligase FadD12 [Mycobacterium paraintracellulare]BCO39279.1 acyl-CoA synthetase [Mycobacterium paraintracellulare]
MATSKRRNRLSELRDTLATLVRARLLTPLSPDKYIRMVAAVRREGTSTTIGIATSARRCPDRPALVDEIGTLSYKELDVRCNALAAALQALPKGTPQTIGIMCRNHRGFVEALAAANKVGADVLLLNTSFAGPALAEVVAREGVDAVVYDEEFTGAVERALADNFRCRRIIGWTDDPDSHDVTVEKLIAAHTGQRPAKATRSGKLILLTSGTTGTPKGAKHSGGGPKELKVLLERVPWHAEETTVIAAPMFHAWGLGQLLMSTIMACTVVTRRKFDPQATLELVDRYRASGLSVVPVMLDRIMDLPDAILQEYSGRSLRFVNASGSRMRPDVVIAFMDRFGDIVYNNYNATEAGMITVATPEDLRAAPDTAGRPAVGTELRILDDDFRPLNAGQIGQIFVHNSSQFDGYTSGNTKDFHEGFMASGDVGYLDDAGRLFVVGRDDEMIISGGENVYPIEVERTLVEHDEVAEASVIGIDDEKYGQRLVAFVVLENGASATPETLKQHIRDSLASYKVPRDIAVLDELPRNSTGKILRSELQARAAADDAS